MVVRLCPTILLFTAPWRHTLIKMDLIRELHNFIFLLPIFFVHFFVLLYAHSPLIHPATLFSLPHILDVPLAANLFSAVLQHSVHVSLHKVDTERTSNCVLRFIVFFSTFNHPVEGSRDNSRNLGVYQPG